MWGELRQQSGSWEEWRHFAKFIRQITCGGNHAGESGGRWGLHVPPAHLQRGDRPACLPACLPSRNFLPLARWKISVLDGDISELGSWPAKTGHHYKLERVRDLTVECRAVWGSRKQTFILTGVGGVGSSDQKCYTTFWDPILTKSINSASLHTNTVI